MLSILVIAPSVVDNMMTAVLPVELMHYGPLTCHVNLSIAAALALAIIINNQFSREVVSI